MTRVIYPSYGLSGTTKNNGISGTTKDSKNGLDVFVLGNGGSDYTLYESKTFTITGAQTNYNVETSETMFAIVETAKNITVYADVACTVKLNATGNSAISLLAGEEINITGLAVTNLFITTTADTVIRVVMFS